MKKLIILSLIGLAAMYAPTLQCMETQREKVTEYKSTSDTFEKAEGNLFEYLNRNQNSFLNTIATYDKTREVWNFKKDTAWTTTKTVGDQSSPIIDHTQRFIARDLEKQAAYKPDPWALSKAFGWFMGTIGCCIAPFLMSLSSRTNGRHFFPFFVGIPVTLCLSGYYGLKGITEPITMYFCLNTRSAENASKDANFIKSNSVVEPYVEDKQI